MSTGTARLAREKTIATLARNLYQLDAATRDDRRRVERALIKANPVLGRADNFKPGRIVIVPQVRGILTTDRVNARSSDLSGLVNETATRLELGARLSAQGVKSAGDEIAQGSERLTDQKFRRLAKEALPESAGLIEETLNSFATRKESLTKREQDLTRAFSDAQEKVTELSRVIRKFKPGPEG